MTQSSSGDLYWIENQFVVVNMYLKRVKKKGRILTHNGNVLWAQIPAQIPDAVILHTLQNGPATPLHFDFIMLSK